MPTDKTGSPYIPGRLTHAPGQQLKCRGGALELAIFSDTFTAPELQTIKTGRAEFAVCDTNRLIVLCYHFSSAHAPVYWTCVPYQWHLEAASDRLPLPTKTRTGTRAAINVVVVDATIGTILMQRRIILASDLTSRLYRAIAHQASGPWDKQRYERDLRTLLARYPTPDQLVTAHGFQTEKDV